MRIKQTCIWTYTTETKGARKENIAVKLSQSYDQLSHSEHYHSQSMKDCHVWQRLIETTVQCETIQ